MMDWIKNGLILLFGLVASIFAPSYFVKNSSNKKVTSAKTEAEAELDLIEKMESYACTTEHGFEAFDKVAKAQGGKCSVMKQEWLLMKLQNYAMRQGYNFDLDKWTEKTEKFIAATKEINTKK